MWLLYHTYMNMYMTAYIYRFDDMTKDIVGAFKFITMVVQNIFPDTLRWRVELWSNASDDLVKMNRCVTPRYGIQVC